MSKSKKKSYSTTMVKEEDAQEQSDLKREEPKLPNRRPAPVPVFSFDRYFASLKKPNHHKAGMQAWLNKKDLKSKKTVAEWDRLFANY